MADKSEEEDAPKVTQECASIDHLWRSLEMGCYWPHALLEAMSIWTVPEEIYNGQRYNYFIGGEAFDWLQLAARLWAEVGGLIPELEMENLLFTGKLPVAIDETKFRNLLGIDKYRGYLNYYYGVTVEESLQLAAEIEIHKRHSGNGNRYQSDFSEEAFVNIYRSPRRELLRRFRKDMSYPTSRRSMTLTQSKEFTYWLFKYRLAISDKARTASDTRKGIKQLHLMRLAATSLVCTGSE